MYACSACSWEVEAGGLNVFNLKKNQEKFLKLKKKKTGTHNPTAQQSFGDASNPGVAPEFVPEVTLL